MDITTWLPTCLEPHRLVDRLAEVVNSSNWSNFGPQWFEARERLASLFGVEDVNVLPVASGTAGLESLLAISRPNSVAIPSWSFAVSAQIIRKIPKIRIVDVEIDTWAIPDGLEDDELVLPTAPFGQFLPYAATPNAIIDAASCFDSATMKKDFPHPTVFSTHVTKGMTSGEGGVVVGESDLIEDLRKSSNFGMSADRVVHLPGSNWKMSEFHAAVLNHSLDTWEQSREILIRVRNAYIEALSEEGLDVRRLRSGDSVAVSSTLQYQLDSKFNAENLIREAEQFRIGIRRWWPELTTEILDRLEVDYSAGEVSNGAMLRDSVVALPYHGMMDDEKIRRVVSLLVKHHIGQSK